MKLKIKTLPYGGTSIKLDNKEINTNVLNFNITQNSCEKPTLILEMAFEDLDIETDILTKDIKITERVFL